MNHRIIESLVAATHEVPGEQEEIRAHFASLVVTGNPREDTAHNAELLRLMLAWAVDGVERLYGECASPFHPRPIFMDQPRSQILPLLEDPDTVAVVLGSTAMSWEDVFYDMCHESVHLLNAVFDVKNKSVSSLEEGCAVKFAESMYDTHVQPFSTARPRTSPVDFPPNLYLDVFLATKKIPDAVLMEVRNTFTRFSSINDLEKFRGMVDQYVIEKEICLLASPFRY